MAGKKLKKTMVYLPEELHEGLRVLAFERKTPMAALVRRAVELAKHEADSSSAITIEEYRQQSLGV